MKRRIVVLAAFAIACSRGMNRAYQPAGPAGEAVRRAFNADEGKTRVLILADPS